MHDALRTIATTNLAARCDIIMMDRVCTLRNEFLDIIKSEKILAKTLYPIRRRIHEMGFEAANHYYYNADAMLEKILNCEYLEK